MTVLEMLVEATPPPPHGLDVDALIEAFAELHARRQAIMDAATSKISVDTEDERELLRILRMRQNDWLEALGTARDQVRDQRIGTTKLRGYAAGVGG